MKQKPVVLSDRAQNDVDDALRYYAREASEAILFGFLDSLEDAYKHIGSHPGAGSQRYAHALGLPGLRSHLLAKFPYLIFYVDRPDHIDVWRILHAQRDISARIADEESS